ncbi:hypothetical protein TKK_0014198 [Trichogramma kaykai]
MPRGEKASFSFPFEPGINALSPEPFMARDPVELAAAQGVQLPLLLGHNTREGILFLRCISTLRVEQLIFKSSISFAFEQKDLQFELDPEYPEAWEDVLDATMHRDACAQPNLMTKAFEGSEDCMYLNIYTRQYKSGDEPVEPKPVMVLIQGGAFLFGSGDDTIYEANYLLKNDIVLVTLNYRLGVLGFLNLEDELAPGNQGLKDLVKALEWIRDNISTFGGDPEKITSYALKLRNKLHEILELTKNTKGLYRKIVREGSALNPWAHMTDDAASLVYKLCEILDHTELDHEGIMRFFRGVPIENLIKAQTVLWTYTEKMKFYYPFDGGESPKKSVG